MKRKKYKFVYLKPSQSVKGNPDYGLPSELIIDHSLAKHHTILAENITLQTFSLYIRLRVYTLRSYELFLFRDKYARNSGM